MKSPDREALVILCRRDTIRKLGKKDRRQGRKSLKKVTGTRKVESGIGTHRTSPMKNIGTTKRRRRGMPNGKKGHADTRKLKRLMRVLALVAAHSHSSPHTHPDLSYTRDHAT